MGRITAKGAGAILMGILNPLLAILPLMEEGKGKDSPCGELIAQATKSTKQPTKQAGKPPATKEAATSSGRSAASGETAPRPPSRPEN